MSAAQAAGATIVGRLAPSPTGHLHLGHARSFLVAWWHARARGGRVVLRIEDLDVERVKPGMIDETLRDLEWLGLDWDGSPWIQSEGLAKIQSAADALAARGLAYPCICTRREVAESASAPQAGDVRTPNARDADAADASGARATQPSAAPASPPHQAASRYPGTCRGKFASIAEAERTSGRGAALRFVVEPGAVSFTDGIAGAQRYDIERDSGDFPILRRAGFPAYQLAVVVDDARHGVTEIVRGDDLLESTARQILLQRALALESPRWWHVPLVVDATGRRFAKRSDDIALARLRGMGLDPRVLVSWVARRSGIADAEPATAREFAPHFDMARLPPEPVVAGPRALAELGLEL